MTTVQRWTGHEACALRLALRLTVREFAERLGVAVRTVSKWEAGSAAIVPRPDTQSILDTALGRADREVQHRFEQLREHAPTRTATVPAVPQAGPDVPAAESMELTRRMAASDLGSDTLDQLDEMVERLAVDYFTVSPAEFHGQVLTWRRYAITLFDRRATLRERSRLYAVAARLTGLLAEVSLALGADAEVHCATALSLAQEIGHAGLAGWVRGTQAQIALYAGDPREAVAFAQAGSEVAPVGSAALVRCHTHLARASARCGERSATEAALIAAECAWQATTQDATPSIFSLSPSYLAYCATTAFVWLGDPDSARTWADQAINTPESITQPTVGRAIAHLDLAIALAQSAEPEEASAVGREAIHICTNRLTIPARRRFDELLAALDPFTEPYVVELRERWQWISK